MKNGLVTIITKEKILVYYEKYMLGVGIFGQLLFYTQAVKIFRTQSAADVSLLGFIMGLISVSSWLVYGLLINDRALIISNTVAVLGALFVVIAILIYG